MTEVFIVALADLVDLLLEVVSWTTNRLAVVLVSLTPVLELVVARAVERTLALTALEQRLLTAHLAARCRTPYHLLNHSISAVISSRPPNIIPSMPFGRGCQGRDDIGGRKEREGEGWWLVCFGWMV